MHCVWCVCTDVSVHCSLHISRLAMCTYVYLHIYTYTCSAHRSWRERPHFVPLAHVPSRVHIRTSSERPSDASCARRCSAVLVLQRLPQRLPQWLSQRTGTVLEFQGPGWRRLPAHFANVLHACLKRLELLFPGAGRPRLPVIIANTLRIILGTGALLPVVHLRAFGAFDISGIDTIHVYVCAAWMCVCLHACMRDANRVR